MRRSGLAIVCFVGVGLSLASIVPACSSNDVAGSGDAGGDAIAPNRPENEPCDPSLPNACLPAPCRTVRCDPYAHKCVATLLPGACSGAIDGGFFFDVRVADSAVKSGCHSDHDCPSFPAGDSTVAVTYACAFYAYGGCSAAGACVLPEPPLAPDGAVQTGCGCNGEPVPYVTSTSTGAPVASPFACDPSVADAGTDAAKEAGSDAGTEAGEAGMDSGVDAAEDATLDAASDG
jgi:hypothetical protein